MKTNASEVDIVIVTWNTRELTCKCVESVLGVVSAESISSTIWVVDNNSSDGTVETLHELFPEVQVISNERNAGFSVANNIAIRRSASPLILLLNSDAFLHPGCLSRLVSEMRNSPSLGAVGPKLFLESGDVQHSVTNITSPISQFGYLLAFYFHPFDRWFRPFFSRSRAALVSGSEQRDAPLLSAACLLLRRDVLEKIGLLPEDRFLYSEEDDLFFRMRENKIRSMFLPKAEATHLCGASTKTSERRIKTDDHFIRSRLRFLFKYYPKSHLFIFLMHWGFFSWCKKVSELKYAMKKRCSDQDYISGYKLLITIVKEEYSHLRK